MKTVLKAAAAAMLGVLATCDDAAAQTTTVRVGCCARTISSAAVPFAVAIKMGWFEKAGIKIEPVPVPGSGDCTKLVATKDVMFALPSAEPVLVIRPQGADIKIFYTAYQGNIYGYAVPEASPIKTVADLKGKKVGVIGMGSAGAIVARALAVDAGLDPVNDISIVVAGEGAQTAALLASNQIDALSQFDTQYAMIANAGVKLRLLDHPAIANFPSNGLIALAETLKDKRREAVALAKGYAMGTVFALANPEAGVRILWEVFPQTKATGKDEATALRDDVSTLNARAKSWKYESVGAKRWGDNVEANYTPYIAWLLKNGVIKEAIPAKDLITNDLLDDVNAFDTAAIQAEAKAYKGK